jgi:hypothetical protein
LRSNSLKKIILAFNFENFENKIFQLFRIE